MYFIILKLGREKYKSIKIQKKIMKKWSNKNNRLSDDNSQQ